MEKLYELLSPVLESKIFGFVFSVLMFLNMLALVPQVVVALTAENLDGVSGMMWTLFAAIQMVMALHAIRVKSWSMFIAMTLSLIESIIIISAVIIRN